MARKTFKRDYFLRHLKSDIMEETNNKFKLITFASNKDGTKIYCRLALNKKTLIKGYYDFNNEKFFITKYIKKNFIQGVGKNTAKKKLEELLEQDYDWNL